MLNVRGGIVDQPLAMAQVRGWSSTMTYAREVDIYDRVVALYPAVEAEGVWFRPERRLSAALRGYRPSQEVVAADEAVCALVIKAAGTHASIKLLTDSGQGDDGLALCRVLLENTILLEWLLKDPLRLDLYCLSPALFKRRWADVIEAHYPDRAAILVEAQTYQASEEKQLADEIFGETHHKWANRRRPDLTLESVSLEQMFVELANPEGGRNPSFMRDAVFFRQSAAVHSTADLVGRIATRIPGKVFMVRELRNEEVCDEALSSANFYMLAAVSALDTYAGLDLETRIDELMAEKKASIAAI